MAPLPLTTTISATSSRASSPMEADDTDNPFFNAVTSLEYSLAVVCDDSRASRDRIRQFLTNATPDFPLGLPHALGLHITDGPLNEALTSQAELIRALTAEVRGLAAMVHEHLPPPGVSAPAPPAPAPTPTPKPSAQPPPPKLPTTKPSAPPKAQTPVKAPPKPTAQTPSFASITKSPARPSLVLSPAPHSSPALAVRKTPSEICAHLNGVLSTLLPGSSLSAARWTKNDNLVIVAGPDTTSQHLQKASAALSTAVAHFIAADPSQPIPISAKENVRWSRLLINNIPTGASSSRGAYSPSECHDTLLRENPAYRALSLTRLPSWVKRPDSYAAGSSSSLVVCFEDPTGLALRTLLSHRTLFAFGQAGDLRPWKQKPRAKPSSPLTDRPLAPA
ncbi:hypothetical protein EDB84DRAFT_1639606 [Lactarius hengduanensis]|nr:hypothetical protein EDB84DRAFT_1639606 [Lactarius hengduanensis]